MWFVKIAAWLAVGYAVLVAVTYFAQTALLFPTSLAGGAPDVLPDGGAMATKRMPDGVDVTVVRIAARKPDGPRPLVLGFGGNAWNAAAVARTLHWLYPANDVMAVYYRGYPPSGGRPSAKKLLGDAVTVFDGLEAPRGVVAVGFSIGAGVAAHLAAERSLRGLILVTPFDSLTALASHHYPWAPVRLLLRNRIDTATYLRDIDIPTAIITAETDTVVPAERSAPLRAAAKRLVFDSTISGAGHNDLYDQPAFVDAMRAALGAVEAGAGTGRGRN